MFRYELTWHDGSKEVIEGDSISQAFTLAGYSGGAITALSGYRCLGKVKE